MSVTLSEARQVRNRLLDKLSDQELAPALPFFDLVHTAVREVLVQQGNPITHIYFPGNCAHSCIIYMEGGNGVEVGTIGNEGFTCVEALFDAQLALETVVCQVEGASLRIANRDFQQLIGKSGTLTRVL